MSDTYRFSSVCVHECACVSACVRVRVCREKKRGIGTTDRKNKQKKRCCKPDPRKKRSVQEYLQRRKQDRNVGAGKGPYLVTFYSLNFKRKEDVVVVNSCPVQASSLF